MLVKFKDGTEVMGRMLIPVGGGKAVSNVPTVEFHSREPDEVPFADTGSEPELVCVSTLSVALPVVAVPDSTLVSLLQPPVVVNVPAAVPPVTLVGNSALVVLLQLRAVVESRAVPVQGRLDVLPGPGRPATDDVSVDSAAVVKSPTVDADPEVVIHTLELVRIHRQ